MVTMELLYKPDFEEAARRWEAFWHGELIDRPPTVMTVRREGAPERPGVRQLEGMDGDFEAALDKFEAWAETMYFAGEAMPQFRPSFGPDQFTAFLGGEIVLAYDSADTTWVRPCVDDWADVLPLRLDPANKYWQQTLSFFAIAGKRAAGKFLVCTMDSSGNAHALATLRGFEQFCLDMVDQPELVDRLMAEVMEIYPVVYDELFNAASMGRVGWTTNWAGIATPGKGQILQCDFSAVMSPEMFRRWVRPALEAESEFLDHAFYHLDGPDALVHLPELLAIPRIGGIQWVPGAALTADRPQYTWVEIFHKIQKAGKTVQVWGSAEDIKWVHPQLQPQLVTYNVSCQTPAEADELLSWLGHHS